MSTLGSFPSPAHSENFGHRAMFPTTHTASTMNNPTSNMLLPPNLPRYPSPQSGSTYTSSESPSFPLFPDSIIHHQLTMTQGHQVTPGQPTSYTSSQSSTQMLGDPAEPNTEPEVTSLAVDNLAKDFSLTEEQRLTLQTFLKFGKVGKGLPAADLLTQLYSTALMLHLENKHPKEDENDVQTIRAMINDLRIRLQTFSLSSTQNRLIHLVAHNKVYDPLRTCYMDIGTDVFVHLRANAEQLGFSNIMGNPAYEHALEGRVNKICSSVRNQFRQHIIDSITKKPISAADFTHNMNKTYCHPGGPEFNSQHILLRNIVLRRFVYDRHQIDWAVEEETESIEGDDNSEAPNKKRKRGGRVARGCDFWSLVDTWYKDQKKDLGKKLTDPRWKELLEEYTRYDESGFRETTGSSASSNGQNHMQTQSGSGTMTSGQGDSTLAALIGQT
ncbi:uncharacterized protein C8R40DRAFT_1171043 [Lentinula edodes]|uniref:uncharacterized protein n=1 Tax=Lentinula edodes TaxID=5353 RepID=UPI001E8CEC37|nr:uncharacterized protein C8R40DRAFT_1171043 [Lentinula edodes]KAH7874931.1 hypothetical protein C8R40DRAFT_1171043 [Lentinula edodes]